MRLKLKGKIGITLLVVCLVFSSLSLSAYSGISAEAASITDNEVFLKQTQSGRCTLSSVAMMLRRKALLDGNGNWSSITEETLLSTAWVMNQGLRWSFSYAGMSVNYGNFSGNAQNKKEQLTSLLNQHPEGVVIYMYGGGNYTHAVLATSYENGTVYVADPAGYLPKGIIPMTSAYLSGSTQDERIGNLKMYWYVSNGSCNLATPAPAPAIHTHSWSYKNDSTHPHSQYRICSCGAKEYTSARFNVPSCAQCRPLGNVRLTRSFNKVSGNADFRRNNVSNATSYTLTLYKDGVQYGSYNMSSLTSYSVTGLSAGNYSATLTVRNDNTGETRSGSCSNFKIVNTYSVNYDANGGSGAPSGQSKIQNEALTLSSSKPSKPHYVFKGWASSRTADVPQYQPGGFYSKNSKITLYAVWEPETYNVKFDLNGGKGECSDRTITYGDTAKMPNSAVKDGFYLKGWSAQKNASNPDYKLGIDYKIDSNLTLYAVWGNSTWTDEVASSFAGGDGTEQNPYLISNASELAYLAQLVNSQSAAPEYKYYKLTDNINLGYSEWIPIGLGGNENQYFCGQFDGNGYTISDLCISNANEGYIGLFGKVQKSEIKNTNIVGDISGVSSSNTIKAGALIGMAMDSSIHDCGALYVNVSDISAGTSEASSIACLVGNISGGEFNNNKANESYIFLKTGKFDAGILAGYSCTDIEDCIVNSKDDELFGSNSTVGAFNFGGIVGYSAKTIKKCSVNSAYLSNTIKTSQEINIGGIAGQSLGDITLCSAVFKSGALRTLDGEQRQISIYATGSGNQTIGGIVGNATDSCEISQCKYNGQSISGTTTSGNVTIGGLAGKTASKMYQSFAYTDGVVYANANKEAKSGGAVGNATNYTDSIKIGDYVQMGTYYGQPILWRCVSFEKIKGYDSSNNPIIDSTDTRTTYADGYLPLMLSDKIICLKAFDAAGTNTNGSHGRGYYSSKNGKWYYSRKTNGSNYWGDSNIRCWLNSAASAGYVYWACGNPPTAANLADSDHDGYNAYDKEAGFLTNFTYNERKLIKKVTQKSLLHTNDASLATAGTNELGYKEDISSVVQNYSTAYSENLTDTIFLLDIKQLNTVYNNSNILDGHYYMGQLTKEAKENSEYSEYSSSLMDRNVYWNYMLRTPCERYQRGQALRAVQNYGSVTAYLATSYDEAGVRPAFFLNPSNLNFVGKGNVDVPYKLPTDEKVISSCILSVSNRVSSVTSGSNYKAMSGDIVGSSSGFEFDNVYSNAGMDLSAVDSSNSSNVKTETLGASKTLTQIKQERFLTTVFGPTAYKSLDYLTANPTAVWVIKNEELPELYYNCLRDITISRDIENGTVTADKTQAIDGEAVTLSVKPNDGYELNTVYVNGKEIAGTSFEMSGDADIYATFKPVTPEYSVKVEANSNATASLTKNDESSVMLLSAANATQLTAKDGEEVLVNTAAAQDYTVDSVYVNGEEIAANSFIVTDDSTVTLAVQSLSTDIKAVTNDAAEIGPYFATLSGEVQDDNGNVKYIRYWKADEPETVFVTEPGTESGTYSATVMLDSDTEYEYQMLENGEIKSFKTLSSDDGAYQENTVLTETVCTSKNGVHTFDVTLKKDIGAKMVMLALYDSADKLLCVKNLTFEESKLSIEINAPTCSTAKIFVWDRTITPQSVSEVIKVK